MIPNVLECSIQNLAQLQSLNLLHIISLQDFQYRHLMLHPATLGGRSLADSYPVNPCLCAVYVYSVLIFARMFDHFRK